MSSSVEVASAARRAGDVKENIDGTSKEFKAARDELESALGAVGADARVSGLVRSMKMHFRSNTAGTWKPYAACILRALGEDFADDQKRWRVKDREMEWADRAADGDEAALEFVKRKRAFPPARASLSGRTAKRARADEAGKEQEETSKEAKGDALEQAGEEAREKPVDGEKKEEGHAHVGAEKTDSQDPQTLAEWGSAAKSSGRQRQQSLFQCWGIGGAASPSGDKPKATSSPAREASLLPVDVRQHYATLGLQSGASAREIRAAYRGLARAAHPDKGGSAAAFDRLTEAFCGLLRDPAQRAACGEGPVGAKPPLEASAGSPSCSDASKVAAAILVSTPESAWAKVLAGLSTAVVRLLSEWLNMATAPDASLDADDVNINEADDGDGTAPKDGNSSAKGGGKQRKPGIYKVGKDLWAVKIAWRRFVVRTSPVDFDRAADIHMLLMEARESALKRHADGVDDLKHIGRACTLAEWDAECTPLLDSELQRILHEDPLVTFYFSSDMSRKVNGKDARVMSRFTPVLSSALHFRSLIRKTLGVGSEPLGRADQIEKLRDIIKKQVLEERWAHQQSRQRLAGAVEAEVARRLASEASLPQAHPLTAAALKDTVGETVDTAMAVWREAAESNQVELAKLRDEVVPALAPMHAMQIDVSELRARAEQDKGDRERQQLLMESRIEKLERCVSSVNRHMTAEKENEELREELLAMQQDKRRLQTSNATLQAQLSEQKVAYLQEAAQSRVRLQRQQRIDEFHVEVARAATREQAARGGQTQPAARGQARLAAAFHAAKTAEVVT